MPGFIFAYESCQGKGWGAVPWMLWMRSGDRKYIEKAEAHSRHSMDVDTGHVDDPKHGRHKGGTNDYRPVHFGEANFPVGIWNDSEYLSYAFHLAGYDRAADVILERQHALLTLNDEPVIPDTKDLLNQLEDPTVPFGPYKLELRCTRDHYRTFGELAIIYEETHHPELMMLAERFLNAFQKCQAKNGWMPGVKTAEWFSQSFLIAARAFPGWKHCIVKLLQGWEDHIGMREKPSLTGQVEGPTSLWTLLELEKKTGDPIYGRAIAGYATARALGVYADDLTDFTNSNPETVRWRGYSTIHGYHLARVMRDWMAALARLAAPNMPVVSSEPAGMAYFRGHLPAEIPVCERVGRHVIYVLEETDQPFDVQLDFAGDNQDVGGPLLIRVYDPDATASSLPSQEINGVFENNLVDGFRPDDALETIKGRKGKSNYDKAKTVTIPTDGKTGAYAFEVISRGTTTALGIAARSSLGRVVHYIPQYEDRLAHFLAHSGEFCETELRLCPPTKDSPSSLDSACSHNLNQMLASLSGMQQEEGGVAGRAWFQPKANATVTLEFADGATKEPNFNLTPYDPALKLRVFEGTVEKCTTKISGSSGTSPLEKPTKQSCTFATGSNPALHNIVLLNYGNYRLHTDGTGEFFASSQEEWFDPTMVNHPPQTRFLSPEVH